MCLPPLREKGLGGGSGFETLPRWEQPGRGKASLISAIFLCSWNHSSRVSSPPPGTKRVRVTLDHSPFLPSSWSHPKPFPLSEWLDVGGEFLQGHRNHLIPLGQRAPPGDAASCRWMAWTLEWLDLWIEACGGHRHFTLQSNEGPLSLVGKRS